MTLAANPSHLEAVDPVVEGLARAEQTDRSHGAGRPRPDRRAAHPHPRRRIVRGAGSRGGDVQPPLSRRLLDGGHAPRHRQQPGRIHHRSGRRAVDALLERSREGLRRSDHPCERRRSRGGARCDQARARLSRGVRPRRRHRSRRLPALRSQRAGRGGLHAAAPGRAHRAATARPRVVRRPSRCGRRSHARTRPSRLLERTLQELREAHDELRASFSDAEPPAEPRTRTDTGAAVVTAVPAERLLELNEQLLRVQEGFEVNPKLARQLERRREAMRDGGIDWGHAEALAFASLLEEGIPIRLSGQDTERGTFSHRHAVLHDPRTGETYTPLQQLPTAAASFEIYNSPLSEFAALAFEHGYSIAAPDALVLWEAQFGDFVNGAQIVVDQFIVSGRSKWGQTSRLTLLLPHGYEGNGPEHSSARLERFLQQAAQDNIRVVNCTTAGQLFHLLRRQALDATARPLVVMTPKGLLRLRQATSTPRGADVAIVPAGAGRSRRRSRGSRAGSSCAAARSTTTSSATSSASSRPPSRSPASSSSTRSRSRRCGARLVVPGAPRDRVGAGGAPEHGRLALDAAPARGGGGACAARGQRPVRRPTLACEPERGLPGRCIIASRTGSCARRSASARGARSRGGAGRGARATTRRAGPLRLAASRSRRSRCSGGSRRQASYIATRDRHRPDAPRGRGGRRTRANGMPKSSHKRGLHSNRRSLAGSLRRGAAVDSDAREAMSEHEDLSAVETSPRSRRRFASI